MSNIVNCAQADHHVFVSSAGHGIDIDVARQQAATKLNKRGESTRIHRHPHGVTCSESSHEDFGKVVFVTPS